MEFRVAYILLAALILIRFIPLIFSASRTWGFNQYIFLPAYLTVIYALFSGLLLFWPFSPWLLSFGEKIAKEISAFLFSSPNRIRNRILVLAVAAILFISLRMPTHFLGDGYALLSNLASPSGTFVKWTEKGIVFVQIGLMSVLGAPGESTALWTFRIISFLSGLASLWFFLMIADILGETGIKKLLIVSVITFSGSLLLFFGYVENYPLLWPALAGFTYFGVKHIKSGSGLSLAALFLILGIIVHLEMAIFMPALIFMIFVRGRGYKIYRALRPFWWMTFAAVTALLIFLFQYKIRTDLFFENIFLPIFGGKPIAPSYSIFSPSHLADMVNLFLLLSPVLPVLIILALHRTDSNRAEKNLHTFLLISFFGALLFLLAVDPTLGMARDWDLFSLSAFSFTLFISRLISSETESARRLMIPTITLAAIAALAFLAVNLGAPSSARYCQYIINLDRNKSFGALVALHRYYLKSGDIYHADSVNKIYYAVFADELRMDRAEEALEKGDYHGARELSQHITPDKFSSRYHMLMSNIFFQEGDPDRALREMDQSIQLQPYNGKLYLARAMIYSRLGRNANAIQDLRQGYRYNTHDKDILEGLAALYLYISRPDSAVLYAKKLAVADSSGSDGYYYLSKAFATLGNIAEAKKYLTDFSNRATIAEIEQTRRMELEKLISNLEATGR
ncbi:membrane hypothetical protein [Candidatus Zixiibacteriota bacterium]|nr:membrane hypothetical protein [candidate division Zixibacteria bacterium]